MGSGEAELSTAVQWVWVNPEVEEQAFTFRLLFIICHFCESSHQAGISCMKYAFMKV